MSKFMKNVRQTGSIGNAILGVVFVSVLLIWASGFLPASPDAVKAVVQSAHGNDNATTIVTSSLEQNPTPTISELRRVRDKVNEALVLQASRDVTGNPTLKSSNQIQTEDRIKEQQAIEKTFDNEVVSWTVKGVVGCMLLLLAINGFNSYKRRRD